MNLTNTTNSILHRSFRKITRTAFPIALNEKETDEEVEGPEFPCWVTLHWFVSLRYRLGYLKEQTQSIARLNVATTYPIGNFTNLRSSDLGTVRAVTSGRCLADYSASSFSVKQSSRSHWARLPFRTTRRYRMNEHAKARGSEPTRIKMKRIP